MSEALIEGIIEIVIGLIGCYFGFVFMIKKIKERDLLAFFLFAATIFSIFILLRGMYHLRIALTEYRWIQ